MAGKSDYMVWCSDERGGIDVTLVMSCFNAKHAAVEYADGHHWGDQDEGEIVVLVTSENAPDDPPKRFRIERELVARYRATEEESDDGKPAKEGG